MSIKVSECLCDHDECYGQYVDSIGLGVILSCNCVCHYSKKLRGMKKLASQTKPPTADRHISSGVLRS